MSAVNSAAPTTRAARGVQVVRFFTRFTREQRWQHWLLFASFAVLFLTGIVQKYRNEPWSQNILSTPERLELVQNIHHIAAIILTWK
jgi:cytochrome b subunit of formate dehydrogenase